MEFVKYKKIVGVIIFGLMILGMGGTIVSAEKDSKKINSEQISNSVPTKFEDLDPQIKQFFSEQGFKEGDIIYQSVSIQKDNK